MRRPKTGDVVEVPTTLGYFYGLVTHRHNHGDVTRFWSEPFATPPSALPPFDLPEKLLTKQCIFKGELSLGELKKVCNIVVPDILQSFPVFRAGTANHKTKKVELWWLWDGEDYSKVGKLDLAQQKLPRMGASNNEGLVIFLEGRTHSSLL